MKSGTTGNIVIAIQKGTHIERLHAVNVEADDADMIGQVLLTIE